MINNQQHKFHLVDPSPWPLLGSLSALMITIGGVMYMHFYNTGDKVLYVGLLCMIIIMVLWWRDVIREATFQQHHTGKVQKGLRYGMILFIISEVMFFFAFFWAFFHSSLAPTIEIGCKWPPEGIKAFSPFEVPLLNTLILLLSGATITLAHHALLLGKNGRLMAFYGFVGTIILAVLFTSLQIYEYREAPFSISDGVYGSTFFMATGFHGFHVLIGTTFIIVCLIRFLHYHFTSKNHFGFEAAAWYWHFVDVVWLFLFVSMYFWGSYDFGGL